MKQRTKVIITLPLLGLAVFGSITVAAVISSVKAPESGMVAVGTVGVIWSLIVLAVGLMWTGME